MTLKPFYDTFRANKNQGIGIMLKKVNVVVFDFDGTLSSGDCSVDFGKYCFRHSIKPWFYLPCLLVASIARFFNPAGTWWRQQMRAFLTPKMVREFVPGFIKMHQKNRFGWSKEQVAKERAAGNVVVLISASADYVVPKLVSDMKFDAVLTSKTQKEKPWKYDFVCWGKNKVVALDNWAKENKFIPNVVRSYSDSRSDMPLMNIAKDCVWINRKTGLRKN